MSSWPISTLKEAGVRLIDCDHKTPKEQEEGMPYVGIPQLKNGRIVLDGVRLVTEDDFHHWRRKAKPTADDVILSRRCNPGEIAYVPANLEIALGQNLVLLRSDGDKVFPPFLRWICQGHNWWQQVNKYINVGAVFDSLKCADIPKFEFKLPPMNEQKRIAKILGDLDKKIELHQKTNKTLEEIAQAMFKSWFVDFEPTRAKIAAKLNGQDPERAAMAAISGKAIAELEQLSPDTLQQLRTTAALFPDKLVDSELGEIPEGWVIQNLESFGDIVCGKTPSKKQDEFFGEDTPFIKIPDMHDCVYSVKVTEYLSDAGANSQRKKSIPAGSVCVSCIATVGKVLITHKESHTNQQINSIVPAIKEYTPFLYFLMSGLNVVLHDLASGGSATLNLNTGNFSRIEVIKPDIVLIKRFFELVDPNFQEILSNSYESEILKGLRDSLLPKLLSGELDISTDA
jgi:type I restriction enzyme S subunit